MSTTSQVYRLVKEIWIEAPPERVFRAFTDSEASTRDAHQIGWLPVLQGLKTHVEDG